MVRRRARKDRYMEQPRPPSAPLLLGQARSSCFFAICTSARQMEETMAAFDAHVHEIEAKVTALSNALATLGRGTTLGELLKLIHFPGYTTPAEFAMTM